MDVGSDVGKLGSTDLEVRVRPGAALAGPVVFAAVAAVWVAVGLAGWVLAWAVALPMLWIAWTTGRAALRAFGPGNWVLREAPEALEVRLRSFWNDDLPDEPIVLRIPWSELACVRRVDQRLSVPDPEQGPRAAHRERRQELELWTAVPLPEALHAALARETSRRARGRTHFHHHLVHLGGDSCLRIVFRGPHGALEPHIGRVLERLRERTAVQPPLEVTEPDWSSLDGPALDQRILDLAERGDRVRAIAAARTRYGYDLVQAREFVDELLGTPRAAA